MTDRSVPKIISPSKRSSGLSPTASLFNTVATLRPLAVNKKKKTWQPKNWQFEDEDEDGNPKQDYSVNAAVKLFKRKSSHSASSLQLPSDQLEDSTTAPVTLPADSPLLTTEYLFKSTPIVKKESIKEESMSSEQLKKIGKGENEKSSSFSAISTTPSKSQPRMSIDSAIKNRVSAEKARQLAAEAKHRKTVELGEVLEGLEAARLLEARIREDRQAAVQTVQWIFSTYPPPPLSSSPKCPTLLYLTTTCLFIHIYKPHPYTYKLYRFLKKALWMEKTQSMCRQPPKNCKSWKRKRSW
jgi:hypothetical protein